jgi:hypothetical protein
MPAAPLLSSAVSCDPDLQIAMRPFFRRETALRKVDKIDPAPIPSHGSQSSSDNASTVAHPPKLVQINLYLPYNSNDSQNYAPAIMFKARRLLICAIMSTGRVT